MNPQVSFATRDPKQFFSTLRKRVNTYFKETNQSKNANAAMIFKSVAMYAMYLVPFGFILSNTLPFWGMLIAAAIMGIGMCGIGFSVMHDANHGSYTKNSTINKMIGDVSMLLIGGSSFTWKVQHNMMHHTYTNIYELDEDIHDKPMLRLSPHGKLKGFHKYQHIYASFLYMLMTFSWFSVKDFKQYAEYNKSGLTEKAGYKKVPTLIRLIFAKLFYVGYLIVVPLFVFKLVVWQWLLAFTLMHFIAGFTLAIVFQLAHVVEGTEHHRPTPIGTIENTWAIHQLATTADFARNNRLITWFVGGLNFQVEHHLFPKICHIHYKDLSEIVKNTAKEFGIVYHDQPTFMSAVASHYKVLKYMGRGVELPTKPVVTY